MKRRPTTEDGRWRRDVLRLAHGRCACGREDCFLFPLETHHVFPVAEFPEYRYERWNGKALCERCHCEVRDPKDPRHAEWQAELVAAGCLDGKGAEYVARLEVTWEAERDAALRAVMTGEDHPLKAAYMMPPDVEAAIMALHAEPEPEPEPDPKPAVARDLAARIAALPVAVLAEAIAALSPDDITTIESLLSDAEALALAKAILALTPEQKAEALKALLGGE